MEQKRFQKNPIKGTKFTIAISSAKGGVGKSTVAINLAFALQHLGLKIGILDADVYGPSLPKLLNLNEKPKSEDNKTIIPLEKFEVQCMSMGLLIDEQTPMMWRGPMVISAIKTMTQKVLWRDRDFIIIDMPPGTGDIQLTLAQRIPVTGAVIVTTPQNVALMDATKGIELFNKVNIPVLGVIENMSTHICSNCGHEEQIFGTGGGDQLSEQYEIPLLGRLPLNVQIRENADNGKPSVVAQDEAADSYMNIAQAVMVQMDKLPKRQRDDKRIF